MTMGIGTRNPAGETRAIAALHAILLALVAFLGIAVPVRASAKDQPMTFSTDSGDAESRFRNDLVDGGNRPIWASGDITPGTTERFLAFVAANHISSGRVFLDSPGGSLIDGMTLGQAIRKLHFNTEIRARTDTGKESKAICASACAYVFAGGLARFYDEYSGRLGIHQFYSPPGEKGSEGETQAISGVLVAYLKDMGVDSRAFTVAALTSPDDITWLTPEDAVKLGFANNGVMPTTAKILTSDLKPSLWLEQRRYNMTTQATFMCLNRQLTLIAAVIAGQKEIDKHLAGLKGAYIELDGGEPILMETGRNSIFTDTGTVGLTRALTPDLAARLLKADELHLWTENDSPVRWGAPIDLRNMHREMLDFFKQCFDPEETVAPVLGQSWDLYIIDYRKTPSWKSMTMIDRKSISRSTSLARARSYAVIQEPGHKPVFLAKLEEYDCADERVRTLSTEFYKPDGKVQNRLPGTDWTSYGADSNGTAVLRRACGTVTVNDPKWALGDREPFAAMRAFLAQ